MKNTQKVLRLKKEKNSIPNIQLVSEGITDKEIMKSLAHLHISS